MCAVKKQTDTTDMRGKKHRSTPSSGDFLQTAVKYGVQIDKNNVL